MKLSLTINGQDHTLEIIRGEHVSYLLDGAPFDADVVEIEPGVYSLLIGGKSFYARVGRNGDSEEREVSLDGVHYDVTVRDPRRWAGGRARLAVVGPQNVAASMPGKVVRVLVAEGQAVESGQGLIVVEAMKMQNEIKCPKAGTIQRILAREGQPVNAGDVLLTVE